jgi:hypothetical protein
MNNIKVVDKNNVKILSDNTESVDIHLGDYKHYVNILVNGLVVVVDREGVRVYDETDTQINSLYFK